MNVLAIVLAILFTAVAVVVLWTTLHGYVKADVETQWEALLASARGSATMFWIKMSAFFVSVLGDILSLADFLDFPGVKDEIQSFVSPDVWPAVALGFLLIGFFARRRTL